jgi:hypothetical protein
MLLFVGSHSPPSSRRTRSGPVPRAGSNTAIKHFGEQEEHPELVDEVESLSAAELEEELRGAGFDPVAERAHATALLDWLATRLSIPIECLVQDYKLKGAPSGGAPGTRHQAR